MSVAIPIWESNPIEYLIRKRYPLSLVAGPTGIFEPTNALVEDSKVKAGVYRNELKSLSSIDLNKIMDETMEADDRSRPYSRGLSRDDFLHWAKMPYLNKDEAVALLLGKNPNVAKWETIENDVPISRLAYSYAKLRELISRAMEVGKLNEHCAPNEILVWARYMRIEPPDALAEAIASLNSDDINWEAEAEKLQSVVEKLSLEVADLRAQLFKAERPLNPRERSSYQKMIIGMAMDRYGYVPGASRTSASRRIADALRLQGLLLDEETILNHLREAQETLP